MHGGAVVHGLGLGLGLRDCNGGRGGRDLGLGRRCGRLGLVQHAGQGAKKFFVGLAQAKQGRD